MSACPQRAKRRPPPLNRWSARPCALICYYLGFVGWSTLACAHVVNMDPATVLTAATTVAAVAAAVLLPILVVALAFAAKMLTA